MKIPLAPHPRLLVSKEKIAQLKTQDDPISRWLQECVIARADLALAAQPTAYVKEGRRLLNQSRLAVAHVTSLALAALFTGDPRYTARAVAEMDAAADFPDWNPSHFLDTAEMTLALALGYDWLYDEIEPAMRVKIAGAILEKGIRQSFDGPNLGWISGDNNWNQVCHSGMTAGALALAELEPELAEKIVARAVANLPIACESYRPDGAYAEGPMYWEYGTSFHVVLLAMLESVFGQRFGLDETPGFLESARYIAQVTGPSSKFFNYADADEARTVMPGLFWFARRLNDPEVLRWDMDRVGLPIDEGQGDGAGEKVRLLPLAWLWWNPQLAAPRERVPLPLSWMARGHNPVAVHRSAWDDPDAVYAAIKGGSPGTNHAQMDSGAFVLEADGVRWAIDLGRQMYHTLESAGIDLWNKTQASTRWSVFRLGSEGHNILRFNGAPQRVSGFGEIIRFNAGAPMPHTVLDLSSIYADQASEVLRGIALLPDRRVLFQDEWITGADATVDWQMITRAKATALPDAVLLEEDGKSLRLEVLEPARHHIVIREISEPRSEFDAANPNARMIVVSRHTKAGERAVLRIVAVPESSMPAGDLPNLPLLEWSQPPAGSREPHRQTPVSHSRA